MEELITSFIIQSKECKLPEIGKFRVVVTSAEPDIANKQISPPVMEFLFTGREDKISDDLVKYIATKRNMEVSEALMAVKKWCMDTKQRLKNGEEIILNSLGSLKKGNSGNILFHSDNSNTFFEPVSAERVIHQNTEHPVLVGDKETTSSAMNLILNEEEVIPSNKWKAWSIILLSIVIVMLLYYFFTHSFSFAAIGNQVKIGPHSTGSTYTTY